MNDRRAPQRVPIALNAHIDATRSAVLSSLWEGLLPELGVLIADYSSASMWSVGEKCLVLHRCPESGVRWVAAFIEYVKPSNGRVLCKSDLFDFHVAVEGGSVRLAPYTHASAKSLNLCLNRIKREQHPRLLPDLEALAAQSRSFEPLATSLHPR